jgi:hypothetical protein
MYERKPGIALSAQWLAAEGNIDIILETDRQTGRQTDRQTDKQADRQAVRQTSIYSTFLRNMPCSAINHAFYYPNIRPTR